MSEKVTMNLAQQKLDRNFEWCCMFKDLEFKALSCIGMKDLGRVFGCVEGCLFYYFIVRKQALAGHSVYKKCTFVLKSFSEFFCDTCHLGDGAVQKECTLV